MAGEFLIHLAKGRLSLKGHGRQEQRDGFVKAATNKSWWPQPEAAKKCVVRIHGLEQYENAPLHLYYNKNPYIHYTV